ncbi:MAG: hypothetical protein K6C94_09040 [Candidatus Gastranaerophilales bacterium]|nr:hypothetical protein [Candidatus Gastranaerophilales bacterium]
MQWFQAREYSAGKKRLALTWFLYKTFGEKMLYFIGDLVAFFTFLFAPDLRKSSKRYFEITQTKTGIKPSLQNIYRHIRSSAESLCDKMLVISGNFDTDKITFDEENTEKILYNDINKKQGVFLICNHIGNVEVLQTLMLQKDYDFKIDIFMSSRQSKIFNEFLKTIKIDYPVNLFPVENIGLTTGIELKENLNKGDMVFIAGDRLAQDNDTKSIKAEIFGKNIYLPKGTFKLAKLMEVPVYFISAIKKDGIYKIYAEKQNDLSEKALTTAFCKFLEKCILLAPFQFYHFYDFFAEN